MFAIRGHFSEASIDTGPLMSVPLTSPSGVINTAALSSNDTLVPVSYTHLTLPTILLV